VLVFVLDVLATASSAFSRRKLDYLEETMTLPMVSMETGELVPI